MKPPAVERAVQTTPPIISAAVMPAVPFRPMLTSTSEARISVMRVIPETGLLPTMAMALAATVVKRNEMTKTISSATAVCPQLPRMPNWKKKKVVASAAINVVRIVRMVRSRWVRGTFVSAFFLPENSLTASPIACLMMPL